MTEINQIVSGTVESIEEIVGSLSIEQRAQVVHVMTNYAQAMQEIVEDTVTDNMYFGDAFRRAREDGKAIARRGWNGNGLFVRVRFPEDGSGMLNKFLYIDATAMGGTLNPWQPSQTDLFEADWYVVEDGKDFEGDVINKEAPLLPDRKEK